MKRFFLVSSFILMISIDFATAQSAIPDSGNIVYKFDYIIDNSNRYQEYRVVRMTWLDQLKKVVDDSLNVIRKDLADTRSVIATQQNENEKINAELIDLNNQLVQVIEEKDNFVFMGASLSKSNFVMLVWSVVAVLSVLLLLFIVMFQRSNSQTNQTQKALRETNEEFEMYKKRAMEKEQLLKRELQDELNKRN